MADIEAIVARLDRIEERIAAIEGKVSGSPFARAPQSLMPEGGGRMRRDSATPERIVPEAE